MILIGLIFASGFRKKASYFSPSSSLVNFINLSVVLQTSKTFRRGGCWSEARPAVLIWFLVGTNILVWTLQKTASLRGRDTYWLLWEGVFHVRVEGLKCQFFTLVSVVLAVIFFSLDCWPLLLEPREDNSVPVSVEMSDDTCLCRLTVGQEQSACFNF